MTTISANNENSPSGKTAPAVESEFAFEIEYIDQNDELLARRRLEPQDFSHAIRYTKFDAFRLGITQQYVPTTTGACVEPVFPDDRGASPRAKGFTVSVPLASRDPLTGSEFHCHEFDIGYFRQSANRLRAQLQREEKLSDDQEVYFRLNALLDDETTEVQQPKLNISLDPPSSLQVAAGCRRDYGQAEAWDDPVYADLPVLIEHGVLEESVFEARDNEQREIAGFLLGHVHHDERNKEAFVAVTGLASSAGTTEADETSVTYTPASFAHVREMIKLRNRGEVVVGWYHSHPFKLCAECPLPTPPECIAKILFYSSDDFHLMETTFEQPYMVGLLAAVESRLEAAVGHLPVKLYGWREGQIKERGFEVFRAEGTS